MNAKETLRQYLKDTPTIITVAGNVGLGKTTTAEIMADGLEIAISRELDNAIFDQSLLWKFIEAPADEKPQHCYVLQQDFVYRRLEARRKQAHLGKSFIEDRSPEEDPLIMHPHFVNRGYLTRQQYALLQELWKAQENKTPPSEIMLVLQGSARLAREGIEKRGRLGESDTWQEERDLKPMAELYKQFPAAVGQYGLHKGAIVEIDRQVLDPLQDSHRERIYRSMLSGLRKLGRLI
ncbi:deoxynucleoside kinase [Candidatus Woesearchaeota archaeon]|nr:deoxynucleoside kinase [Candidatus Woesearchaeota archaeon]